MIEPLDPPAQCRSCKKFNIRFGNYTKCLSCVDKQQHEDFLREHAYYKFKSGKDHFET